MAALYWVPAQSMEKSFSTCSLGQLRLRGNNTYWHKIKHRLPAHVQNILGDDDDNVVEIEDSSEDEKREQL